jgi:uncharacterized protein with HEPN domain
LIHFYEGVDLEEVWKMVTSDLPQLIRGIESFGRAVKEIRRDATPPISFR